MLLKKYGHRQPISLIRITKIFSKDGKLIAEAQPQKKLTREIVKGDQERKKQVTEAKKLKAEEIKTIKKATKNIIAKEKKTISNIDKKGVKNKPLTKNKKW